jgi:N-acetylmuramoyl-L-alanine amidase
MKFKKMLKLIILAGFLFLKVNPSFALLVIDPGHGGSQSGAVSSLNGQNIYEKDLNLQVSYYVRQYLERYGFSTYMTREGDIYLSLEDRVNIANSKPTDLFISIHHNSSVAPSASGVEAYYYGTNQDGRFLADLICRNISEAIGIRNRGAKSSTTYYVLKNTRATAVLVECGFVSNSEELAKLVAKNNQEKIGKAVADAVRDFFVKKAGQLGITQRIFGEDRINTAVEVSSQFFQSSKSAILVNAFAYADALCASSLAGALKSPVFLIQAKFVPDAVLNELKRLQVESLIIVGGNACVDTAVENMLKDCGYKVERIAGRDRFETASKAAEYLIKISPPPYIFIASSNAVADAISCSNLASRTNSPILFVKPDSAPFFTRKTIQSIKAQFKDAKVIFVGGEASVSENVYLELNADLRLSGPDRYSTSVKCQEFGAANSIISTSTIFIVSGIDPVDALTVSAVSLPEKPALLLSAANGLRSSVREFIIKNSNSSTRYKLIGGPAVVPVEAERQVVAIWINN